MDTKVRDVIEETDVNTEDVNTPKHKQKKGKIPKNDIN